MSNSERLNPTSKKLLIKILQSSFFLIGIATILLGQILPILSSRLSLNDREAGYFFIAQFSGSLIGSLSYSRIIEKFGYRRLLLAGFCMMACGCAGVNLTAMFGGLAAIFLVGLGIGLTIPAINMLVIELDFENSAAALNMLNFFWGVGAILCKPFIDFVGSPNNFRLPTIILASGLMLIGIIIFFSIIPERSVAAEEVSDDGQTAIWTTTAAWLIAFFNFIHIGIESSVGGWITTYELRLTQIHQRDWLSAALIFFLLLVIGRGLAPLFFKYLSENTVLIISLLVMLSGIIIILFAPGHLFLMFGAGTLGFGSSSVFPTNMSRFTKIFGSAATRNATPIFVLGTLGGASITWMIGFVSTAFNNLKSGFLVILIGCFLLLALQIILANVKSRQT